MAGGGCAHAAVELAGWAARRVGGHWVIVARSEAVIFRAHAGRPASGVGGELGCGPSAYAGSGVAGHGGVFPDLSVHLVMVAWVDGELALLAALDGADFDDGALFGVDVVADLEVVGGDLKLGHVVHPVVSVGQAGLWSGQ